jgi:hypothetical protein
MTVTTRICDLCGKEVTEHIPQIQIMGKPRGGWRFTGYSEFNDICPCCHDKILEAVLGLRVKGAAFHINKDQVNDIDNSARNKKPQYKKCQAKVSAGRG